MRRFGWVLRVVCWGFSFLVVARCDCGFAGFGCGALLLDWWV